MLKYCKLPGVVVGLLFLLPPVTVKAAEIRILCSIGFRPVLERLAEDFQTSTGHALKIEFGTSKALQLTIQGSKEFDVTILTPSASKELIWSGHLGIDLTDIARSGVGVAVRAGSVKPEIKDGPDLLRILSRAKSIAYAQDGASGIYFLQVLQKRGLDFQQSKLIGVVGGSPLDLVANGEAELGIQLISEIKAAKGVELAGPFPPDYQDYTVMTAGINRYTRIAVAANQLVHFLKSRKARDVARETGLEPMP